MANTPESALIHTLLPGRMAYEHAIQNIERPPLFSALPFGHVGGAYYVLLQL
jgi:hypothetical protein